MKRTTISLPEDLAAALEREEADLVLFGHTHRPMTMRVGRALVLNPGESCGFLKCGQSGFEVVLLEELPAAVDLSPGLVRFEHAAGSDECGANNERTICDAKNGMHDVCSLRHDF